MMSQSLDDLDTRSALAEIARDFHRRGWMSGTAGNLSARDRQHPSSFWITASGLPKGRLDENDFLRINLGDETVLQGFHDKAKPSAETSIHRVIYQLFPSANACLHIHSVDACLATAHCAADSIDLRLPALEMIKGLDIWEERPAVALPLFSNLPDVPMIAAAIHKRSSNFS
jgi:methylthioribulose-1-phosphate dehydratase